MWGHFLFSVFCHFFHHFQQDFGQVFSVFLYGFPSFTLNKGCILNFQLMRLFLSVMVQTGASPGHWNGNCGSSQSVWCINGYWIVELDPRNFIEVSTFTELLHSPLLSEPVWVWIITTRLYILIWLIWLHEKFCYQWILLRIQMFWKLRWCALSSILISWYVILTP